VLATSGDDDATWSEQVLVRARQCVHTSDPCLWIDPQRRLWFFWAQNAGVQDGRNLRVMIWLRNNSPDGKRSHMTVFVSDDDGATWKGGLLLDERESSYPDGIQAEDGTLFIIYDHQRYTLNRAGKRGVGSVQIAVFS
jgi:hypothetical protein